MGSYKCGTFYPLIKATGTVKVNCTHLRLAVITVGPIFPYYSGFLSSELDTLLDMKWYYCNIFDHVYLTFKKGIFEILKCVI